MPDNPGPTPAHGHKNNFDLIRLLAAFQVVIIHGIENMGGNVESPIRDVLDRFPGVPIFFVISGFLVSQSFERSRTTWDYAVKRLLRIYPALYVCLVLTVVAVVAVGFIPPRALASFEFLKWMAGQLTFFQFERTPMFYAYGAGGMNGSLWTIPVELQFYALVPLIYLLIGKSRHSVAIIAAAIAVFTVFNVYRYNANIDLANTTSDKILKVSVLPYLYMFLLGMLWQREFGFARRFVEGKFWYWLIAYVAVSYAASAAGLRSTANGIGVLNTLVLSGVVISAAYSAPLLAHRLLREQDVSYGIYIYHMPIVNVLLFLRIGSTVEKFAILIPATFALALLSWIIVEKPALGLKRYLSGRVPSAPVAEEQSQPAVIPQ